MRFPVQILAIIILGFFLELFLPWWSVALAAFVGGLLINTRMNFLAGFLAVGLLWIINFTPGYISSQRVGGRFCSDDWWIPPQESLEIFVVWRETSSATRL